MNRLRAASPLGRRRQGRQERSTDEKTRVCYSNPRIIREKRDPRLLEEVGDLRLSKNVGLAD